MENYFPSMAKKYPEIFVCGIDSVISDIKQKVIEKSSIYRASRDLHVKENTLRDTLNAKGLPSLKYLALIQEYIDVDMWERIYREATCICGKTYTNRIKIPKKLTKELAYLAGIFRDGGFSDYKSEMVISQKDKEWLSRIKELLESIFDITIRITGPRIKDGCYYIKFRSVALYAFFDVVLEYKKFDWKTPDIIKNSSVDMQKHYIKGFWEAEGSYSTGVQFFQSGDYKSCEPLEDIKNMLDKMGITSWTRGPYKGVNKPMWTLYIPARHVQKFFEIIKPRHMKLGKWLIPTANSDRLKVA